MHLVDLAYGLYTNLKSAAAALWWEERHQPGVGTKRVMLKYNQTLTYGMDLNTDSKSWEGAYNSL